MPVTGRGSRSEWEGWGCGEGAGSSGGENGCGSAGGRSGGGSGSGSGWNRGSQVQHWNAGLERPEGARKLVCKKDNRSDGLLVRTSWTLRIRSKMG
eukprot:765228-Hanusia_phi.AAC.4